MLNIENIAGILVKYCKAMKLKKNEYIFVDGIHDMVYSVDSYSIKYISLSGEDVSLIKPFHGLMFNYELLSTYSDIMEEKWVEPSIGLIGDTSDIFVTNMRQYHYDIINKWQCCIGDIDYCPETSPNKDITDDPNFQSIMNLKSSDGARPYILDNRYVLYLFPGIIPVLKSDRVIINIIDWGKPYFRAIFTVVKKKINVNVYITYLKV